MRRSCVKWRGKNVSVGNFNGEKVRKLFYPLLPISSPSSFHPNASYPTFVSRVGAFPIGLLISPLAFLTLHRLALASPHPNSPLRDAANKRW